MGRKSRNKQSAKTSAAEQVKQNRKWKMITYSIILPAMGLVIWSLILLNHIFISDNLILMSSFIAGLIAAAILSFLWRAHKIPIGVLLIFGLLSGGSVTSFLITATNYYFRNDATTSIQLDVLSTGNRSKRRRPCKMPYTVVVYDDVRKELPFPCDFEKTITSYTKVNLKISKGLFGFYVIEQKELMK